MQYILNSFKEKCLMKASPESVMAIRQNYMVTYLFQRGNSGICHFTVTSSPVFSQYEMKCIISSWQNLAFSVSKKGDQPHSNMKQHTITLSFPYVMAPHGKHELFVHHIYCFDCDISTK
jgi:hypothetical protein